VLMPIINTSLPLSDSYSSKSVVGKDNAVSISSADRELARNESVKRTQTDNRTESGEQQKDSVQLSPEAQEIRQLQSRDREVRAHEAAHAAAGGAIAGSPTYTTKRGPDGKTYVTGGEVSIDISPVKGDPEATLKKAEQVRAAALAPAQPSSQDMRVAQKAQAMAAKARADIAEAVAVELAGLATTSRSGNSHAESISNSDSAQIDDRSSNFITIEVSGMARLSAYA
jgi:hypothetical protein